MKIRIISLLFSSLLFSCQEKVPVNPSEQEKPTLLNVLVYDQSKSFDYAQLESKEIAKLLATDATTHKTWLAIVRIEEKNSLEQKLLLAGPFTLDTLATEGNSIYEQPRILRHNAPIRQAFQDNLSRLQQQMEEDILPVQKLAYSDVNGALNYVLRLVNQGQFHNAEIRLILYTDLQHDMPGDQELQSFAFPPNVTIYPVRVNRTLDYGKVFPDCQVHELVDFRASFLQTSISLK